MKENEAGNRLSDALRDRVVPLFPLSGVVLLPGNFLPLNIFETRYRNLVEDAVAGERRIGMVQPRRPDPEAVAPPAGGMAGSNSSPLYDVGCVGRIARCERQPDGRFVILLKGERRFRVENELPPKRGYRRALAGFEEFADDMVETQEGLIGEELLAAALDFAGRFELDFDADLLASLTPLRLLNVLAAALPFGTMEKQALLEASGAEERQRMLLTLMRMEAQAGSPERDESVVH